MKDCNFYVTHGWMVNNLGIKGNDVSVFAIIYGFSQDQSSEFNGSLSYLEKSINASRNTVLKSLKNLVNRSLIVKSERIINKVKFCTYSYNAEVVQKLNHQRKKCTEDGSRTSKDGSAETEPNSIVNNKGDNKGASEDASQSSSSETSPEKPKAVEYPKEAKEICRWFYDQLTETEKKAIKSTVQTEWLKTIDQCNRLDKIPYPDLLKAVKWAKEDPFWKNQFRSITKLRKKGKDQLLNFAHRWVEASNGNNNPKKEVFKVKPQAKQDYE
ncbi:MAG: hypothetical protein ACEPOW_13685 [Bacteroidales bacterium]